MIRINGLKLSPGFTSDDVKNAAAEALGLNTAAFSIVKILKQALDARRRGGAHYVVSVCARVSDEAAALRRKGVEPYAEKAYAFPYANRAAGHRPIVVGSGPAGVFCALCLAEAGLRPLLVERGRDVDGRIGDVARFFQTGELDERSNVQFGEGGAGTFSDGKLSTGTRDERRRFVLERYAQAGAPEDILYLAKPHMGTDRLRAVAKNMRGRLIAPGGEIAFETQLTDIRVKNGMLEGVELTGPDGKTTVETRTLALAIGHSARDTFEALYARGVEMRPKSFAVGVRIEHLQRGVDLAQYGGVAEFKALPAADYKLAWHAANGRSAFTFCVCPGGDVVAAASERGMAVTNGMSAHARAGQNCNGALLVGVTPEDFPSAHPLSGIEFQRGLERAAFALGGGGFAAPAQLVKDFLAGGASAGPGGVLPTYRPGVRYTDVSLCLPAYVTETLRAALPEFGKKIRGFDAEDAILTAVESRSSSPVRIPRDAEYQANIRGVYPCGEGAGYAGGILSAAVDGVKCAEAICSSLPASSPAI